MRLIFLFFISILFLNLGNAQGGKIMDDSTYEVWKQIDQEQISRNGNWIAYQTTQIKADPVLHLYNTKTKKRLQYERAGDARFDYNNQFFAYIVKPAKDSIRAWKRAKKDKSDFGKDTLHVLLLKSQKSFSFPNVDSYKLPEKWGSILAFEREVKVDSTDKKEDHLVLWNTGSFGLDTIRHIVDYKFAEESNQMIYAAGKEKSDSSVIRLLNCLNHRKRHIFDYTGYCKQVGISKNGSAVAYSINADTLNTEPVITGLYVWKPNYSEAVKIPIHRGSNVPLDYHVSPDRSLDFSDDGKHLFFGTRPLPLVQDTNLIDEEIVDVEIWTSNDQTLYTQQENQQEREKKRSYLASYNLEDGNSFQMASEKMSDILMDDDRMSNIVLGIEDGSYRKSITFLGYAYHDVYLIDREKEQRVKLLSKEQGNISMSPEGKYALWYNREEGIWKSIDIENVVVNQLTEKDEVFADELNDRPMDPRPYGTAFWLQGDDQIVIYDRYDLWLFNTDGSRSKRLTKGREQKKIYRYIDLNKEDRFELADAQILLHVFDENDKSSGYATMDLSNGRLETLEHGPYSYTRNVLKAESSSDIVFTKESFDVFPDLIHSKLDDFNTQNKLSNANPQQAEYKWGDIELVKWTSATGKELEGLIVKPEDFDPSKQYPLLVNFYERSSNRLHRHRAPYPHRSTINYTYYVNRGYIIFNPDVHYDIGYPGKSCEDAVISGVEMMKENPWIDPARIGVQGHSWGGYQIAHLLTKTNIFKCAEAGAPVVNMVSAYGGIRWGSGMSRMFQYERTQSRLGGTLWEKPELYLENSPIFNIDKHDTPVLILHNDKDGAVPWYQGIEYFVALRRLNKPAWFLNYNDEPHWPLKLQNRLDFNKRMQQFFDHYLMGTPMPRWMDEGVPAINKSIDSAYELIDEK